MEASEPAVRSSLDRLDTISQRGRVIAEYVWIDGGLQMRSKCRTLSGPVSSLADVPDWNFDGSSCELAPT